MQINNEKDDLVDFIQKVDLKNPHIKAHIDKLTESGLYFEIYMWYSILIEANLSIYLAIHEELIQQVGEIYNLYLKQYVPDEIKLIRKGHTLGRLIDKLKKVSANKDLIAKLDVFKSERNSIIHRFIDKGFKINNLGEFQPQNEKLRALVAELHEELNLLKKDAVKVGKRRIKQLRKELRKRREGPVRKC